MILEAQLCAKDQELTKRRADLLKLKHKTDTRTSQIKACGFGSHKATSATNKKSGNNLRSISKRVAPAGASAKRRYPGSVVAEKRLVTTTTFKRFCAQRSNQPYKHTTYTHNTLVEKLSMPSLVLAESDAHCRFYSKTGSCARGTQCHFKHDDEKRTLCYKYLNHQTCPVDCRLSHVPSTYNRPMCRHFQHGECSKEDCRYAHVHLGGDAKVCEEFRLQGWCQKGFVDCDSLHASLNPAKRHKSPQETKSSLSIYPDFSVSSEQKLQQVLALRFGQNDEFIQLENN